MLACFCLIRRYFSLRATAALKVPIFFFIEVDARVSPRRPELKFSPPRYMLMPWFADTVVSADCSLPFTLFYAAGDMLFRYG